MRVNCLINDKKHQSQDPPHLGQKLRCVAMIQQIKSLLAPLWHLPVLLHGAEYNQAPPHTLQKYAGATTLQSGNKLAPPRPPPCSLPLAFHFCCIAPLQCDSSRANLIPLPCQDARLQQGGAPTHCFLKMQINF